MLAQTHGEGEIMIGHAEHRVGWRAVVWGGAAVLLLLPWVAMQFTREVAWTLRDFVAFGAMLSAACVAGELAVRATRNRAYRAAVGAAVVAAFLLVWITLAVGIVGSETGPANLMYFGVLAVGIAAAFLGRFRPQGMVRALLATAAAQLLAGAGVLVAGWGGKALVLTLGFVVPWLVSAWLFRRATRELAGAAA